MARDHGRVLCKIWQDKDFRALPRTAQALYIQLLSQPNVNNAGVLPFMVSKWAKGCDGMTPAEVLKDLAVLVDAGFLVVDTDTEEVLIRSFIRNDGGLKHKYIFKNALTMAEAAESEQIRRALAAELRRIRNAEARRVANVLDPSESESDAVAEPSGTLPNAEVNPSESHSNPVPMGSESGMAFESHSDHCGVGEGEGVGDSLVVGHLGGDARAGERTHTREEPPPAQPNSGTTEPPAPWCTKHPGGTDQACRACQAARLEHERYVAEEPRRKALANSERAKQAAEARAQAIANCGACDDDGFLRLDSDDGPQLSLCAHDAGNTGRHGRAEFRKALAEMREKRSQTPTPEELERIRADLADFPADPSPEPVAPVSVATGRSESASQDEPTTPKEAHV